MTAEKINLERNFIFGMDQYSSENESIVSIVDETVIKVFKEDFIKKHIKNIKELLRK